VPVGEQDAQAETAASAAKAADLDQDRHPVAISTNRRITSL
jgi:hypothetical protein